MKLYAEYIKERENMELIESENGFATYSISFGTFYLAEMYVRKSVRGTLEAYKLYKRCLQIAKDSGCVSMLGSVDTSTVGWQYSVKLMKRLGFEQHGRLDNLVYFCKNI